MEGNGVTQIFRSLQNWQFHHRRLESLENFNVLYIYIYITFWALRSLIFGPYGCHCFTMSHFFCILSIFASTLCMCVMYLTSIWRILLMTDGLNAVCTNDRAAPTDTNPKNLELAPPPSVTTTRLDQLHSDFQTQHFCPQWGLNPQPLARS